ncbi:MAG: Tfp pilus assembly protein FimT/FimU [Cyanobacteriota bacterium]|jgi:prepilin-type N-terminal cleavage/methylation domain-containing protein
MPISSRPHNAFTMIEVLLVSAVILSLSSLALRSMFLFSEQRKLRTAAVELSGYLQVVRNVANAANGRCRIALTQSNGGTFSVDPTFTDPDNVCLPGTLPPDVRLGGLSGSRNLKAATLPGGGNYPLTFSPEGSIRAGATVLLSSSDVPNGAWCVDVQAPLGTVRLGWQPSGGTCNYAIEQ